MTIRNKYKAQYRTLYSVFIDEPSDTDCPFGSSETYSEAVEVAEEAAETNAGVRIFIYKCEPVAIAQIEKQVSTTILK